ncbi:MAG: ABC transporter substrate-binding protein [Actinobacteria bacterium]|nr:ABC transporter substrate-binding protein [Actinomycetota bacterium]
MRLCSLLPSATEIVGAVGLADSLVGRSAECDWPPEVRPLPVVTAARIDTSEMASFEIDRAVREAIADGRSLYALDEELIEALDPDLVLTQDLCAVYAVSSDEVSRLCAVDAEVVSLDPRTIPEIERSVLELAQRLGVPDRGARVAAQIEEKIDRVRELVAGLEPRRVFVAEWLDPPFATGHWVPEMVAHAGGEEVLGRAGEASFATTWEAVRARSPDLVVLAPCGFDAARAAREAAALPPLPCRAVAVDANAYFSRAAPRVADGIAQLAFLLHPEAVPDPGLPWIELVLATS